MTKHSIKKRVETGKNTGTVVKQVVPVETDIALTIYRKERWGRLKTKGYTFDMTKNRATYCGTIAVPENGDPGYKRPEPQGSGK